MELGWLTRPLILSKHRAAGPNKKIFLHKIDRRETCFSNFCFIFKYLLFAVIKCTRKNSFNIDEKQNILPGRAILRIAH